jgi:hypothetical protein
MRLATSDDEPWLFQLHESAHRELVEAAYGPWIVEQRHNFFRPLIDEHGVIVAEGRELGTVYPGERARPGSSWLRSIPSPRARASGRRRRAGWWASR